MEKYDSFTGMKLTESVPQEAQKIDLLKKKIKMSVSSMLKELKETREII